MEKPFPKKTNLWENQAIQREYMLEKLNFVEANDYIFFSDPDEIPDPQILKNFNLEKKYGIFFQKCLLLSKKVALPRVYTKNSTAVSLYKKR